MAFCISIFKYVVMQSSAEHASVYLPIARSTLNLSLFSEAIICLYSMHVFFAVMGGMFLHVPVVTLACDVTSPEEALPVAVAEVALGSRGWKKGENDHCCLSSRSIILCKILNFNNFKSVIGLCSLY